MIACEETLDNVYEKQMRAFRLLRPRLSQYAYVFRTNLSSFVDLSLYLAFCERLPRTKVYSGVIGVDNGIHFASGSGFTITPDLIERLLDENPPEVLLDDVTLGKAITSWGILIIPAPRIDYVTDDGQAMLHTSPIPCIPFHRRIKTSDRWKDVELLRHLFRASARGL